MSLFDFSNSGTDTSSSGSLFDFSIAKAPAGKYVGPYAPSYYNPSVTAAVQTVSKSPSLLSRIENVAKNVIASPFGFNTTVPSFTSAPKPALQAPILTGPSEKDISDQEFKLSTWQKELDKTNAEEVNNYNAEVQNYLENVSKYNAAAKAKNVLDQNVIPVGQTIKFPFVKAGVTVPAGDGVGGGYSVLKSVIEAPEKSARSLASLVGLDTNTEDRTGNQTFQVPSYAETAGKTTADLIDQGLPPAAAVILASANTAGQVANDVLPFVGGFASPKDLKFYLDQGAIKAETGVAGKFTPQELKTAYEFLGYPEDITEARKSYLEFQHQFHPDKTGGSDTVSKQANNAYKILKSADAEGIKMKRIRNLDVTSFAQPPVRNQKKIPSKTEIQNIAQDIATPEAPTSYPALKTDLVETAKNFKTKVPEIEGLDREQSTALSYEAAHPMATDAAAKYWDQVLKPALDEGKPTIIGADNLKDYFGKDYNEKNHAVYSGAANQLFKRAVDESPADTVKVVIGGTGSGKSKFAVPYMADNFTGVIYDSTGYKYKDGLKNQIDYAESKGKKIEIYGIVSEPEMARAYALEREEKGEHPVTEGAHIRTHVGAIQSMIDAIRDGKDVYVLDARGVMTQADIQQARFIHNPLDMLENLGYTEEYVRTATQKVTKETFKETIARRAAGTDTVQEGHGGISGEEEKVNGIPELQGQGANFRKGGEGTQPERLSGGQGLEPGQRGDSVAAARRLSGYAGKDRVLAELVARQGQELHAGRRVEINNTTLDILHEAGFGEQLVKNLDAGVKQGAVSHIVLKNQVAGKPFVSALDGDTIYLNPDQTEHESYISGRIIDHELAGHAWYKKQAPESRAAFYDALKNDKKAVTDAWRETDTPYRFYWQETVDQITRSILDKSSQSVADRIIGDFGLGDDLSFDDFMTQSLNIDKTIDAINAELARIGKDPIDLKAHDTVAVEEHVALFAESASYLAPASPVLENYASDVRSGSLTYGPNATKALVYQGESDLSTTILEKLKGKRTVSKQFIQDLTNAGELKQVERDLIRDVLDQFSGTHVSQFTTDGKEGKFWTTPEGADSGFGDVKKDAVVDTEKLYKGTSSLDFIKERKLLTPKVKKAMEAAADSNDPNMEFKIPQDIAEAVLKKEGYPGAHWTYEDDLNPTQYQIWDKSIIKKPADVKIPVAEFAKAVKAELLPLKINPDYKITTHEGQANLPDELRGNVADYKENIYESPISTSAGNTHFSSNTHPNYFGHTRIEDMAPKDTEIDNSPRATGTTRRVIEVQSDLYQKGNLEQEFPHKNLADAIEDAESRGNDPKQARKLAEQWMKDAEAGKKLQQYNDPTAHFRMIREEVKQAAIDGTTKLQFPTGETAMKIEGLGETNDWYKPQNPKTGQYEKLTPDALKIGNEINRKYSEGWIITDVLGDGKFKAVQQGIFEGYMDKEGAGTEKEVLDFINQTNDSETFDISGKVDTQNPIYKFYEKEVGRYLKNRYGADKVTDDKGVTWYEVNITPDMAERPVLAFRQESQDIDQLRSQLERAEESLAIAKTDPALFAKAYGPARQAEVQAKVISLKQRMLALLPSDIGVRPVKISIANKDVPLPPNLQAQQEAIEASPFNQLEKYVVQSGDFVGQLPEVLGTSDLSKTSYGRIKNPDVLNFIRHGDEIIQEVFGAGESYVTAPDTEDVREQMEQFQAAKKQFAADKKEFIQNYKDELAIEKLAKEHALPLEQRLDELNPPAARGGLQAPRLDWENWHDIMAPRLSRDTLERNVEKVAPKGDVEKLKTFLFDKVKANDTAMVLKNKTDKLRVREAVKKSGITIGGKLDFLVTDWAEGKITEEILNKEAGKKAFEVKKLAGHLRNEYDKFLDFWNAKRAEYNYPPIPRLRNYMRHASDISFFDKSFGFLKSQQELPTSIAGISEFFKPGKPFTTAELRRKGAGRFSAIKAMNNYIDSVNRQAFHIDSIQRGRAIQKYRDAAVLISENTAEPIKLANFKHNFDEYIQNGLAGKVGSLDRNLEKFAGRPLIRYMSGLANLVGKNIIVGNISAALSHLVTFPMNLATVRKVPFIKGLMTTLTLPLTGQPFNVIDGIQSAYLTRRFPTKKIVSTKMEKIENAGKVFMYISDSFKTRMAVAGKYYEGLENGLSKEAAMQRADDYAGRLIGDNSTGQIPTIMNQKMIQVFTQFERGLNDSISVLVHDIPRQEGGFNTTSGAKKKSKIVNQLVQFAIYSFLFNQAVKKIRGSGRGIDPIGLGLTLAGWNDEGYGQSFPARLGMAGTDLAGELPFTSLFTGNFPVTEALPHFDQLATGKTTWTAEGERLLADLASPFGGGLQAKKSIEGLIAYARGYAVNQKGVPTYPIDQTATNAAKVFIFGPSGAAESTDYYGKINEGKAQQSVHTSVSAAQTKLDKLDPSIVDPAQEAWNKVQKLGVGTPEADAAVNNLTDAQYTAYKDIKAADADYQENLVKKITPVVEAAHDAGFGTPEADKIVAPLSDEDYAMYKKVKNALFGTDTGADITGLEPVSKPTFMQRIAVYANAVGTDPVIAFKDIFKGQEIKETKDGKIYVERMSFSDSQNEKKARGGNNPSFKLDHIVPLEASSEAGGTNVEENLQLIPTADWEANTPVENFLAAGLENGTVTTEKAREYAIRFKAGRGEPLSPALQKEYKEKYNSQPLTFEEIQKEVQ